MTEQQAILESRKLTKEFKGFVAVKDVNLRFEAGKIHALIGSNPAGKTTFFNLLTKFLIPTAAQIIYKGVDITQVPPARIACSVVVRSFQISAEFPHLTSLDNVRVAIHLHTNRYRPVRGKAIEPINH
jgi:branched-chain amino acid transport system ATP-binding protein